MATNVKTLLLAKSAGVLLVMLMVGAAFGGSSSTPWGSSFGMKNHKSHDTTNFRRELAIRGLAGIDPKSVQEKLAPLPKKPATIVTAYFKIPSKTVHAAYLSFIKNFLSLQDFMIIYTTPDLVEQLKELRPAHLMERTTIITMALEDTPLGNGVIYSKSFWENQLEMDEQRKVHKSYQLFQIWASKTWFVQEAITANPYGHDIFVWTDMGAFRDKGFNNQLYAAHTDIIPRDSMLMTSSREGLESIAAKNADEHNGWITHRSQFYQIGGFQAGYADTFQKFHIAFMETFEAFVSHGLFVGEDQFLLQTTCNLHYRLCSYITPDQTPEVDTWWTMKQALHGGGSFQLFYPPMISGNASFKGLVVS